MVLRATLLADLICFLFSLALVSRLAGLLAPIDSPSTALDNDDEVESEARRASRLGFGAKLCIHPRQVSVVNHSLKPPMTNSIGRNASSPPLRKATEQPWRSTDR